MDSVANESAIRALVKTAVESYAVGFQSRHQAEVDDPEGTLNMKIHNVFIAALGPEIQYYTALVRSLDSSLGNMLESLAVNLAGLFFDVHRQVEGPLSVEQTRGADSPSSRSPCSPDSDHRSPAKPISVLR